MKTSELTNKHTGLWLLILTMLAGCSNKGSPALDAQIQNQSAITSVVIISADLENDYDLRTNLLTGENIKLLANSFRKENRKGVGGWRKNEVLGHIRFLQGSNVFSIQLMREGVLSFDDYMFTLKNTNIIQPLLPKGVLEYPRLSN